MEQQAVETQPLTLAEWLALGEKLFGPEKLEWRFVCPACKHVQKPIDFRPYKEQGVTAETAYMNCIGRYDGHGSNDMFSGKQPCNYTSGGLLNLNPLSVSSGEETFRVFDFDRTPKE